MNKKVLQKIIDELNKENPKLDYIRGILETLIESLPLDNIQPLLPVNLLRPTPPSDPSLPTVPNMAQIKKLSEQMLDQ